MRSAARLLTMSCIAFLTGCDLAPKYSPPVVATPPVFKEATVTPTEYKNAGQWEKAQPGDTALAGPWWEAFGDPVLTNLEVQVDTGNQTLAATLAIYDQARAYANEAEAGLLPAVGVGGTVTNNKQSLQRPRRGRNEPNYYGGDMLNGYASYEVDIFGRIRDLVAAGQAAAQASSADLAAVSLGLHIELANDYAALRELDEEIQLYSATIVAYQSALAIVQHRFQGDIASGVDVAQAETQLDTVKAQKSVITGRRQLLEHAIATLIGQPAPVFTLAESVVSMPVPEVPPGLPSTLLQRRPDIASAERQVAAANELVGVANAAFYPVFSLGAFGGLNGTSVSLLSLPLSFWTIGPSMSLPLFEGGLRHAELAAAIAAFNEAGATYRQTVLKAFQDVEDNLAELRWLRQAIKDQDAGVVAAKRSVALAMTLYKDGAENYLQVVVAQAAELTAEQSELTLRTNRVQASIGLIGATGGGWTTADIPPENSL